MVTKKKSTGEKEAKRGRVKVGKLKLNKETVKNLSVSDKKLIQGGAIRQPRATAFSCDAGCE